MRSFFSPTAIRSFSAQWWMLLLAVVASLAISPQADAQTSGGYSGVVVTPKRGGCPGSMGGYLLVPVTVQAPAANCTGSAGCAGSHGGIFQRMHEKHVARIAARHAVIVIAAPPAQATPPATKKADLPPPTGSGVVKAKVKTDDLEDVLAKRCGKRKHRKGVC